MGSEHIDGKEIHTIQDNGKMKLLMEKANMYGQMGECTMVTGKIIICKDMGHIIGQMVMYMLEILSIIKSLALENTLK